MIKEALQYIVSLSEPNITTIGGFKYSDRPLTAIDECKRARSIEATTLTSIVDYIKNAAPSEMPKKAYVHIVSPGEVRLISELDMDRKREVLITSNAQVPAVKLNNFVDNENFMIMLQSMFVQNNEDMNEFERTDIDIMQRVVGNVVDDTIQTYTDDGISQQAAIKTGVTTKDTVILPSPAILRPYRTFSEVEQPASKFVFRMKKGQYGPASALFEADGGAWKNMAMDSIKDFFEAELEDYPDITIIC
ncbi:MAG: phage-related protein [Herbinix sp.]|jgi:hypothetical protein|nr:phage-related protein [Herbinix sp.]